MKKYSLSSILLLLVMALQASTTGTQKRQVEAFTSINSSSSVDVIVEQTGQYGVEVIAPEKYFENIKTEVRGGQLKVYFKGSYNYSGNLIVKVEVKDLKEVIVTGSGDFRTEGLLNAPEFFFRVSGSGDFEAEMNSKVVKGNLNGSGDAKISGITESFEVQQSGSGDLIANRLQLFNAKLRMNGSGDTRFSGSSDYFELSQSGSGDFSGRDFDVDDAKLRKSSSGDARITVEKSLDISISGSGDLYYEGKPEFKNISVTGSGDIVKIK